MRILTDIRLDLSLNLSHQLHNLKVFFLEIIITNYKKRIRFINNDVIKNLLYYSICLCLSINEHGS